MKCEVEVKSSGAKLIVYLVLLAVAVAVLVALAVVPAYFEARTFNRLTGASATTWDALWVELRVDGPRKDSK